MITNWSTIPRKHPYCLETNRMLEWSTKHLLMLAEPAWTGCWSWWGKRGRGPIPLWSSVGPHPCVLFISPVYTSYLTYHIFPFQFLLDVGPTILSGVCFTSASRFFIPPPPPPHSSYYWYPISLLKKSHILSTLSHILHVSLHEESPLPTSLLSVPPSPWYLISRMMPTVLSSK